MKNKENDPLGLLLEFEGKEVFKDVGIPVLPGMVANDLKEANNAAEELGYPVVVKGQLPHGGRGKAGLIKLVKNQQELEKVAPKILEGSIKNMQVQNLLIEKAANIENELYVSTMFDTFSQKIIFIMSTEGGVDIEAVAEETPEKVIKKPYSLNFDFRSYHAIELVKELGFSGKQMLRLAGILSKMWTAMQTKDLQLIEINPLAVLEDGKIIALDSKVIIDDNAIYRQKLYQDFLEERVPDDPLEDKAKSYGVAFVRLDGDIGIIGNGAGLVMATCDLIAEFGGKPANFLDVGGGASTERVLKALSIVKEVGETGETIDVLLVNIFGGITRCDDVAQAVVEVRDKLGLEMPFVVRLVGTNQKEGLEILDKAGMNAFSNMESAVKKAVEISKAK
ncbi:MAG: ADP-forming succinate--CoA ligase subunit beta [Candidatus Heimdallarchaeota archaeon]|nr:ADP-forming succinate--CoA ligase subunit beta [Candidatus Heimdallarchaeota archaeon]